MAEPVLGNVSNGSQSIMYGVLSTDSMVTSLTTNIYDGEPYKVAAKYGYPLVIIKPPAYASNPLTQVHWDNSTYITIIMRSKQELNVRKLYDAVVTAITSNEDTFIANNMVNPSFGQAVEDNDAYGAGSEMKVVYGLVMDVFFDVFTSTIEL